TTPDLDPCASLRPGCISTGSALAARPNYDATSRGRWSPADCTTTRAPESTTRTAPTRGRHPLACRHPRVLHSTPVDLQFPSGTLDVPTLRLDLQASGLDVPLLAWGSVKRGRRLNRGT